MLQSVNQPLICPDVFGIMLSLPTGASFESHQNLDSSNSAEPKIDSTEHFAKVNKINAEAAPVRLSAPKAALPVHHAHFLWRRAASVGERRRTPPLRFSTAASGNDFGR